MNKQIKTTIILLLFIFGNIFAQTPGTLKWKYQTNYKISTFPVIGLDNTIYFLSSDSYLNALKNGTLAWSRYCELNSLPTLDKYDNIYISTGYDISVITPHNGVKENYYLNEYINGPSAISEDGTFYASSNEANIFAYSADGERKWIFETHSYIYENNSIAIGLDGTIYFCTAKFLYALTNEAELKWKLEFNENINSPLSIGNDGTIFFSTQDSTLNAINPDGTNKWYYNSPFQITSGISISEDGTIFFGSDNSLFALTQNGNEKWHFDTNGKITSTPAIDNYGSIYFGSNDRKFYALDNQGNEKWAFSTNGSINTSPNIDNSGIVYFGSDDGNLYALYSDCNGLAKGSWTSFGKDNKNSNNNINKNAPIAKLKERDIFLNSISNAVLDASGSIEPNNGKLEFLWKVLKQPENENIILDDSTSSKIEVNIPAFSSVIFSVKVTNELGISSYECVNVSNEKKWEFSLDRNYCSPAAIGTDNSIYFISDKLYSLDSLGNKKWDWTISEHFIDEIYPVVGNNGIIYYMYYYGLVALNPDGSFKWSYNTDYLGDYSNPIIDNQGNIYVFIHQYLHAFDMNGNIKWKFFAPIYNNVSIILGPDETIYFFYDKNLYAINSNGTMKWQLNLPQFNWWNHPELTIGKDGIIYFSTNENKLFAIYPTGHLKWIYKNVSNVPPSIDEEGNLYFANKDTLISINSDAEIRWKIKTNGKINYSPTISSSGNIYFGSEDTYLYVLNSEGKEVRKIRTNGEIKSSISLSESGTIYFSTSNHKFYAFASESKGLAEIGWPKYLKNNQNNLDCSNENFPKAIVEKYFVFAESDKLVLDASKSFDPNNRPISFTWQVFNQSDSNFTFIDSKSEKLKLDLPKRFNAEFVVKVTNNLGMSSYATIKVSSEKKWEYETYNEIVTSQAIGNDGTIYINNTRDLIAINKNGEKKWVCKHWFNSYQEPIVGKNGLLYLKDYDSLFAIDSKGIFIWKIKSYVPIIYNDDLLCSASEKGIKLINANDGTIKKEYNFSLNSFKLLATGNDGTIYFCSSNYSNKTYLSALDTDGTIKWSLQLNGIIGNLAIGSDGTLYFAINYGFYAVSADGILKWNIKIDGKDCSSPAIGLDGTIFFSTNLDYDNNKFYAVDKFGNIKWHYKTDSKYDDNGGYSICSSPLIGNDGTIYFGSVDHKLYAFDSNGILKWTFLTNDKIISSPAMGDDGTLYVGSIDGKLYAIKTESTGLAKSSWPKFKNDNFNSSSAFNPKSPHAAIKSHYVFADPDGNALLDASESTDPNNSKLSFLWKVISQPKNNNFILTDSTSSTLNIKIPPRTNFTFSVKVTNEMGLFSYNIVEISSIMKWKLLTNGDFSSPALINDSTICFSSYYKIYSINSYGKINWSNKFYGNDKPVIDINQNSILYIGGSINIINGNFNWSSGGSTLPTTNDDFIYGGAFRKFYRLNKQGKLLSEFNVSDTLKYQPVIGPDGSIYFSTQDKYLYSLNQYAELKWEYKLDFKATSPISVDKDGTLYFGCANNKLYAVNPDATIKWTFETGNTIKSSASIGPDGTIYFGSTDNKLYALNNDGTIKWEFSTNGQILSSPTIGKDSIIYFGSLDSNFYALNTDGSLNWKYSTEGSIYTSAVISNDGTLYFGSSDKYLYALNCSSLGLAESPWPKASKNNYNNPNCSNVNYPLAIVNNRKILQNSGTINLDATASFDPNGDELSYLWKVFKQPTNSNITISSPNSKIVTINIPQIKGDYIFIVKVTDNNGNSSYNTVYFYNQLKWDFNIGSNYNSSPAIDDDGTIYTYAEKNKIFAINPDGTKKWEFVLWENVNTNENDFKNFINSATLTIGHNGTIYCPSLDSSIYAINHDGTLKWKFENISIRNPKIFIGPDDKLYFITNNSQLVSLFPNGTENFRTSLIGNRILGINKIGTKFIAESSEIYYYNESYNFFAGGSDWISAFSIGNNGAIYYSNFDGDGESQYTHIIAKNTDGTSKWIQYSRSFTSFTVVGMDETLYFGTEYDSYEYHGANALYAIDITGNYKWETLLKSPIISSPALGSDGTIYVGTIDSTFYAFDSLGNRIWEFPTGGKIYSSPAIADDGTIYFCSDDNKLYALASESKGLAKSSWPKYMANNKNNGLVNGTITDINVENSHLLALDYKLYNNYPNPFNPQTNIEFDVKEKTTVKLRVYNVVGQLVTTLTDNMLEAGHYKYQFNGNNLASGIYFYKIEMGKYVSVKKMMLLK